MRNPRRINTILDKIKIIWKEQPDLRFFQLMRILYGDKDKFYLEDYKVEQKLDEIIEKGHL